MNDTIEKSPIVNGKPSRFFTMEEFQKLNTEDRLEVAWSICCAFTYPSSSLYPHTCALPEDISKSAIEQAGIVVPEYEDLIEDPDKFFEDLVPKWFSYQKIALNLFQKLEENQGKLIYESTKTLKYRADFTLTLHQAIGYLRARGNFNEFKVGEAIRAMERLQKDAPKFSGSYNNPNRGKLRHVWRINGDYIILQTSYLFKGDCSPWENFWAKFQTYFKSAKADSVRLEPTQYDGPDSPIHGYEMIAWWD